jgi:pimeloyl-ACP methyl ester carboxylesterase
MEIKEQGKFQYIDEGKGETMLLLHGLFGALSNWDGVVNHFSTKYRVIIPLLPIYTMPLKEAGLDALNEFVEEFVEEMGLRNLNLVGNSLGGHVGLIYTLKNPSKVKTLILTGSSGLFENAMGGSFPRRGSYEYVAERVAYTFYDPNTATKDLIDEVFETTKSIPKALRIVAIAKSAQRHNMANDIPMIKVPTLLVWGLNDTITPPYVAHEFDRLIPNTTLRFVDKCSHAPMMEQPDEFNIYVTEFLEKVA